MWLVALARTLVIAAATNVNASLPPPPDVLTSPLSTRQTVFSIPFRVDAPVSPAEGPREVQLYVSIDGGRTWGFYGAVPPQQSNFLFRADRDGEYWFAIRTIDRSGAARPPQVDRPGLRVVVDTTPPKIAVEARRGDAGQITVRWHISEPSLVADSFTIQYRAENTAPWQPVAIDRRAFADSGPEHGGEVSWLPQAGAPRVEIRAEASDTAGNRDVCHAQVNLVAGAAVANEPPGARPPMTPGGSAFAPGGWKPAGHRSAYGSTANGGGPANGLVPNQAVPAQPNPMAARQYAPSQGASTNAAQTPPTGPQAVNSPLFELEYNIRADIPGAYVELWGTRDNGQSWTSFGIDSDGRSPIVVRVPGEGQYGFRFLVRSPRGIVGQPPRNGDRPDLWITVDLTKPLVRILSVQRETSGRSEQLLVRWEAGDTLLADHAVSLLSGTTANGPWGPVATGLDGKGSFRWRVPSETPGPVYLRVEARDTAGNVGAAVWEKPVELGRAGPAASPGISAGHAMRPAPRRYYFR